MSQAEAMARIEAFVGPIEDTVGYDCAACWEAGKERSFGSVDGLGAHYRAVHVANPKPINTPRHPRVGGAGYGSHMRER